MTLVCPFCNASEDARLEAKDEAGESLLLVMFDCPFHFRFYSDQIGPEEEMQKLMDTWRAENGEKWLDSVGPIMKKRELRNIERSRSSSSNLQSAG